MESISWILLFSVFVYRGVILVFRSNKAGDTHKDKDKSIILDKLNVAVQDLAKT